MVFLSKEDKEWICRGGNDGVTPTFMQGSSETILPGVTAVKTGGHFDGSLVLHWQNKLLIADTFVTVPVSSIFMRHQISRFSDLNDSPHFTILVDS